MAANRPDRAAMKREAKALKLDWSGLDMVVTATGERRVKYPFEKNGRLLLIPDKREVS